MANHTTNGDYYGLPTRIIANAHLRLEFLAQAGPRIVRLSLSGSEQNLLAETPNIKWTTPYGEYYLWGGHRLWHAPEAMPRSYMPDNTGLDIEDLPSGVRLRQPVEAATGIRKTIEVHLHADQPKLTLTHSLQNEGEQPVELAPWAITQLPLGGLAVLPHQSDAPPDQLLPDRHLVLWAYTRLQDARLRLTDEYVFVQALADERACKIGLMNYQGVMGYLRQGVFFVKRFQPRPGEPHPDQSCNAEIYCKDVCLELETLGPLCCLEPGDSVTHIETWELYSGIDVPVTYENVSALLESLGSPL